MRASVEGHGRVFAEEVWHLAAFLASPAAGCIAGANMVVDGGMAIT
ncbi:SDR family oxidoreductase [Nonomuraea sp. H19]